MKKLFFFITFLIFYACRDDVSYLGITELNGLPVMEFSEIINNEGIAGIYRVPAIPCILRHDTASGIRIQKSFEESIRIVSEEFLHCFPKDTFYPGAILYSNSPRHFEFDIFVPFDTNRPSCDPGRNCIKDTLSEGIMLLYHHYGRFEDLYLAYRKIRQYMNEHQLIQDGPMREMYLTHPSQTSDPARWLTRIFIPLKITQEIPEP